MLAVHAYATGLIGVDHQQGEAHFRRHHVTREIQEHVELHEIDLPQKCPNSTVLDYIYKWSLESEEWVLSLYYRVPAIKVEVFDDKIGDKS